MASESETKISSKENDVLLSVQDLHTYFYTEEGTVKAVDGVTFNIKRDEIMGLVGETGCGKSVSALSILKLIRYPGKILSGKIMFEGRDLVPLTEEQIRRIRGNDITMIFQDPLNSLNPVLKVGYQIAEVYLLHQKDILQQKLDYAKTHNAENRIKLAKVKNRQTFFKKFEKTLPNLEELITKIYTFTPKIVELEDLLADDESFLAIQKDTSDLKSDLAEKVKSMHDEVRKLSLQESEKNFFSSKIRITTPKIRKLDMRLLNREIKILLKEINPKEILRIKEEQEGVLDESERDKIVSELDLSKNQLVELGAKLNAFWKEMSVYDGVKSAADKEKSKRDQIKTQLELLKNDSSMHTDLIIRYMKVLKIEEAKLDYFTKEFDVLSRIRDEQEFNDKANVLVKELQEMQIIERYGAIRQEYEDILEVERNRGTISENIEKLKEDEGFRQLKSRKTEAKNRYRELRTEHEAVSKDFFEKQHEYEDTIGLQKIGMEVDEERFEELKYVLEELKRQQTRLYRELDTLKWEIKTEFEDFREDKLVLPPGVIKDIDKLQKKLDSIRINKTRKDDLNEQLAPIIQYQEDLDDEIEELKLLVRKRIKLMDIAHEEAAKIIKAVGIADSRRILDRYPHELSGGMRQRIMISMGLACQSKLLICDEPTTALDVTIQAQILQLIRDLKNRLQNSVLFITHNLGVIYELCDKVAVMYAGNIVEYGDKFKLFENPLHPYTHGLLGAIPRVNPEDRHKKLSIIPGMVPNLIFPLPGCRFHPRCEHSMEICRQIRPQLSVQENGNSVACWLFEKNRSQFEEGSFQKLGEEYKEKTV
jgi:oligopeptide/dipeptide ABC transporter ATP-binding protein